MPAVRRFTLDRCKAYIDQQAYFGGRSVLLVVGEYYCDLQVFSAEQIFGLVVENLRELAEHAAPQGIELAIELEPFENAIASSVHELARLIRDGRPSGGQGERRRLAPPPLRRVLRRRRRARPG